MGLWYPGVSLAGDVGAEGGEVLLKRFFLGIPDHPERLEGDGPLRAERPLPASDSLHVDPRSEPDLPLAVGLGHPGMSLAGDVGAEGGEVRLPAIVGALDDRDDDPLAPGGEVDRAAGGVAGADDEVAERSTGDGARALANPEGIDLLGEPLVVAAHRPNDPVNLGVGVALHGRLHVDPGRDDDRDDDVAGLLLDRLRTTQGPARALDDIDDRAPGVDEGDRLEVGQVDPLAEAASVRHEAALPRRHGEGTVDDLGAACRWLFARDERDTPGGLERCHELGEGLGPGCPAPTAPPLRARVEADHPAKAELLGGAGERQPCGERRGIGHFDTGGVDEAALVDHRGELGVLFRNLGDDDLVVGDELVLDRRGEANLVREGTKLGLVVHRDHVDPLVGRLRLHPVAEELLGGGRKESAPGAQAVAIDDRTEGRGRLGGDDVVRFVGNDQVERRNRCIGHRLGDPRARLVGREDDRGSRASEPGGNDRRIGVGGRDHPDAEFVGT